ncbi:winged helix-turn-helix transcriptional regulator [Polaribacter aestuariivivens]|uniref:Winged helix-turn-helix transcriptional regulator n=1 Tax=Polaribacter aestuariivivens TaxID=2304626 RepID=A0A5S3N4Q3_9FLAO|nr:winged helix-turn-helix domain-containing protein [Polaribacter aestuariivivens]TMM29822.1 winged helix-turn-helix transcriptional regulator [Polaribacter aestuariivivens]
MKQKKFFSIFILAIVIFAIWSFTTPQENKTDFSERAKIVLREVGNQLLLSNKDSVSLILPIKKINDFKYQISFEKPLSFEPNTLVDILKQVIEKTHFHKKYRVEVIENSSQEVAYSYEVNNEEDKTIIPCTGRFLPENNYKIKVQFLGVKIASNSSWLFYIFIPIILGMFYKRFYLHKTHQETSGNTSKNTKNLGTFQFYPEQNKLVKQAKEIPLSKKECELLEIFVANPNKIIKREELTKRVWEDNGVFVGRSLDTYVSKLRKILKEDENIKLINVHGVGYKLEIKD